MIPSALLESLSPGRDYRHGEKALLNCVPREVMSLSPSFFQISLDFFWTSDLLLPLVSGNLTRASISQQCYLLKLFPCCFPQREPKISIDRPLCSNLLYAELQAKKSLQFQELESMLNLTSAFILGCHESRLGWWLWLTAVTKTTDFYHHFQWIWLDQLQTRVCTLSASKHQRVPRLF